MESTVDQPVRPSSGQRMYPGAAAYVAFTQRCAFQTCRSPTPTHGAAGSIVEPSFAYISMFPGHTVSGFWKECGRIRVPVGRGASARRCWMSARNERSSGSLAVWLVCISAQME
jgi:hypothetical protein